MQDLVAIYLFRHGETHWNLERRFQGSTNIALTETGIEQAKSLAETLASFSFEALLSSDLQRALLTAHEVQQFQNQALFEISPNLREAQMGQAEGLTHENVIEQFGSEALEAWFSAKDWEFSFPGGENKNAVVKRVRAYIKKFLDKNKHIRHLAISTHGGVVKRMVHSCEKSPTEAIPIPNCCVYKIHYNPLHETWTYIERLR